jgi:hypothetical protein
LTGKILQPNGALADSFSGLTYLTLFDTKEVLYTIASPAQTIYDRSRVLYTGKDSVANGTFSFKFIVPKDMSYSYETGRINLYAADPSSRNEAQGYFENFIVGGTNDDGIDDNNPPVINFLYLNHPDFKSGDAVNSTPVFFAGVEDETGINISGNGIGHDATITIDHSQYNIHILNDYFDVEAGNSGKGTFKFNIPELSPGNHELTFKVWDIMNNSTSQTIEFTVDNGIPSKIFDLIAAPNPANETINFYLTHDRPDSNVSIRIDVFNLTGQLLWTHTETAYSETFSSAPVTWDLRSSGGQRLSPGVYVYRASISSNGSTESSKAKKMIIVGQ